MNKFAKIVLILCIVSWVIILGTASFYKEPVERYEPYYTSYTWSVNDTNNTSQYVLSNHYFLHWQGYELYTAYEMPMWILPIAWINFLFWCMIIYIFKNDLLKKDGITNKGFTEEG